MFLRSLFPKSPLFLKGEKMKQLLQNVLFHGRKKKLWDWVIKNGTILQIKESPIKKQKFDQVFDAQGLTALAGLVDPHVHMRDMEQTYKATIAQVSREALEGGIVALGVMPNTAPPLINIPNLETYLEILKQDCVQPFKIWFAVNNDNYRECVKAVEQYNHVIAGFKFFLANSFGDLEITNQKQIEKIIQLSAKYQKVNFFHCEDPERIRKGGHDERGTQSEVKSVQRVINWMKNHPNARYHIAHCSTPEAMRLIMEHQTRGNSITFGITPHHLLLHHSLYKRYGGKFLCYPPLRPLKQMRKLKKLAKQKAGSWCLESDHAPHTDFEKQKGVPGLPNIREFFPCFNSLEMTPYKWDLSARDVASKILGIAKPKLVPGAKAQIVLADLEAPHQPKNYVRGYNPFSNIALKGQVKAVILGNEIHKFA